MEVVQEQVTILPDRSKLSELRNVLRRLCRQFSIRPNTTRRLVLAVDEATSNVIEHARLCSGSRIEISLEISEDGIVAQIQDCGIEFDPTKGKRTLPSSDQRLKRGFGLYLIHLITDDMVYQRTADGRNILTLVIDSR